MVRRVSQMVVTACALAACGGGGDSQPAPRVLSDAEQIAMAQEGMRKRLKDPESARFTDVRIGLRMAGNVGAVCGKVNSKNSFGGYSGAQRFIAAGDMAFLEDDMAEGEMDKSWAQLCGYYQK